MPATASLFEQTLASYEVRFVGRADRSADPHLLGDPPMPPDA